MALEHQQEKKHFFSASTAEVLRQVEGAGVTKGGWCGGDAYFGSVQSCVELKKRLDVFSTFVVKHNKRFFPMEILHTILGARHGDKPAGHWVVATAVISSVKVIAIAYAWSQKGVSYFISSCGKTKPSDHKYESKFEDEWGNVNFKTILRPEIIHFLCECCPLIDEHNKARQAVLALEKRWEMRNPWFRLITTVTGMCVVDMYRIYRYSVLKVEAQKQHEVDGLQIIQFTDWICGNLREWKYKVLVW